MPEQWIDELVGDEARPRPGFEDRLARELQREWRRGRTPWRVVAWVTAAAALVLGVVLVLTRDDDHSVVPADVSTVTRPSTVVSSSSAPAATTTTTTAAEPSPSTGVGRYLAALAGGDYDTAAGLLGDGGLELEARADVRPLFRPEFGLVPGRADRAALAAALETWCERALCVQPTDIVELPDGWWTEAVFPLAGADVTALFGEYQYEGATVVTGLPPLLPPDSWKVEIDPSTIVECPVDQVTRVDWADVDGDGWVERLVSQMTADAGGPEDGLAVYRITVCGTTTEVQPFETTGDGLVVYAVNPTGQGGDLLLIGFAEGYPIGTIHRVESGRIVVFAGSSWGFGPPVVGQEQRSLGCRPSGPGGGELVDYTFTESDGRLRYTASPAIGAGAATQGDVDSTSAEAGEIRIGVCNGLPVMTN